MAHGLPAPELKAPSRGSALTVQGLHKVFGREVHALQGVDLGIEEGEFVAVLGPSGSGKTTLLMIVAGFETPTAGKVFSGEADITNTPPQRRNFGVVFQSYALFPHMSVRGNIAYPLAVRGMRRKNRNELVNHALELVGLEGLGARRPSQLSGGQQQRVALARALVYQPSVLLLDEPLGALDRALRERMQVELRNLHRKVGATLLYVTHDQDEALTMADRVVVMQDGRLEQVGTPRELYERPATEFVASFIGSANRLSVRVKHPKAGLAVVRLASGGTFEVRSSARVSACGESQGLLVFRPEKVEISAATDSEISTNEMSVVGRVESLVFAGSTWRCSVSTALGDVQAFVPNKPDERVGDQVRLRWKAVDAWVLASTQHESQVQQQPQVEDEDMHHEQDCMVHSP